MGAVPPRPALTRLQEHALEVVADACRVKLHAAETARAADQEFRKTVVNAANLGCSYEQIAEAAGVSKGRVGQIVKASGKPT